MYMIDMIEDCFFVEASLGGKLDPSEIQVMAKDLAATMYGKDINKFTIMLDYSRAKAMDADTRTQLCWVKDALLELGIRKIINIARDDTDLVDGTTDRIQYVLEGREEFLLEPDRTKLPSVSTSATAMAH
jgi:hypothetical protein